jgi:PTS system ascorbate-specific IIC component
MTFLNFLATEVLAEPAILVGLFALVGLLLQRKAIPDVFTGTVKTIVGMLIFSIGAGAAVGSLDAFQQLFTEGFGVQGVVPLSEGVTGLALQEYGSQIAIIMVYGLVVNLLFAAITPMKYVFLTGQHNLFFAAVLTLVLNSAGLGRTHAILLGGVLLGFFAAFFPWLGRKGIKAITGSNDIGIGHYDTIGYAISSWLGSKIGDASRSTESLKLPKGLSFFRDYVAAIALTMLVFYYVATLAAGPTFAQEVAGDMHWLVFPFMQALIFAGAVYVIITGIRMLLGEIVPAFLGISSKLVKGVKPALDCPAVFPYAPTAVVLGFLVAYGAGLLMMGVYIALGWVVIIPVAIPYFFIGGTAAVFGNATGGWKGAVVGSAVVGALISLGPQLIYPILDNVGLPGSSFPETDFTAVGLPLYYLFELGEWVGTVGAVAAVAAIAAVVFIVSRRERRAEAEAVAESTAGASSDG